MGRPTKIISKISDYKTVIIIKKAFARFSNATPIGEKTTVPNKIADLMIKEGYAK